MARANYKLVGILPGRIVETHRARPGAPSESFMISWAKQYGCHFVGRYYPTLKGWRMLKIDKALQIGFGRRIGWRNYERCCRVYPDEHAMAMHCMAVLGVTPDT